MSSQIPFLLNENCRYFNQKDSETESNYASIHTPIKGIYRNGKRNETESCSKFIVNYKNNFYNKNYQRSFANNSLKTEDNYRNKSSIKPGLTFSYRYLRNKSLKIV